MVSNQLSGRRSNPGTPKVCKIPPEKVPLPPPPPPPTWPDGWPDHLDIYGSYSQSQPTYISDYYYGTLARSATPRVYQGTLAGYATTADLTITFNTDGSQAMLSVAIHGGYPEPNTGGSSWQAISGTIQYGYVALSGNPMANPYSGFNLNASWSA